MTLALTRYKAPVENAQPGSGQRLSENAMKVIGLAGWSGAGKTTLLTRVIPHLLKEGLRVSVIKHAHHAFDVDVPGKDSWRHRQSGATEVLVSSTQRWALMHELRGAGEPRLPELLAKMSRVDLVVIEGFKREPHRKIEVHRAANGKAAAVSRRSRRRRHRNRCGR